MSETPATLVTTMGYAQVTETPGIKLTREAVSMAYSRYRAAIEYVRGKDVLEVACGAGQGLGYLAKAARLTIGGDYDAELIQVAREYYRDTMPLVRFDAHQLPFRDRRFDLVILYEAIYYLRDPGSFLNECRRVLRAGGLVLICTVNKEWQDFNPSPLSFRYFSGAEIADLMKEHNFDVEICGMFPTSAESIRDQIVSSVKRAAIRFNLMPKTMKGKEFLKRVFFGELVPQGCEVEDGMAEYQHPVKISENSCFSRFKVLFAIAAMR